MHSAASDANRSPAYSSPAVQGHGHHTTEPAICQAPISEGRLSRARTTPRRTRIKRYFSRFLRDRKGEVTGAFVEIVPTPMPTLISNKALQCFFTRPETIQARVKTTQTEIASRL